MTIWEVRPALRNSYRTAWVSFGKQTRVTSACAEGESTELVKRPKPRRYCRGKRVRSLVTQSAAYAAQALAGATAAILGRCRTRFFFASPGSVETGHSPRTDRNCQCVSAYKRHCQRRSKIPQKRRLKIPQ